MTQHFTNLDLLVQESCPEHVAEVMYQIMSLCHVCSRGLL